MTPSGDAGVDVLVVRAGAVRCGLVLDAVAEVLPLVAMVPLPHAPDLVAGVIDVHGTLVPVLSLRARLGLPARVPSLDEHVVLVTIADRQVGIRVDGADDVVSIAASEIVPAGDVAAAEALSGVARLPDGLLLVYDVRSFMTADDVLALDAALVSASAAPPP